MTVATYSHLAKLEQAKIGGGLYRIASKALGRIVGVIRRVVGGWRVEVAGRVVSVGKYRNALVAQHAKDTGKIMTTNTNTNTQLAAFRSLLQDLVANPYNTAARDGAIEILDALGGEVLEVAQEYTRSALGVAGVATDAINARWTERGEISLRQLYPNYEGTQPHMMGAVFEHPQTWGWYEVIEIEREEIRYEGRSFGLDGDRGSIITATARPLPMGDPRVVARIEKARAAQVEKERRALFTEVFQYVRKVGEFPAQASMPDAPRIRYAPTNTADAVFVGEDMLWVVRYSENSYYQKTNVFPGIALHSVQRGALPQSIAEALRQLVVAASPLSVGG